MNIVTQLFWPPASPPALGIGEPADRRWWTLTCILLVLPLGAIAHHAVFYHGQCMLNPFKGSDYSDPSTLWAWISRDPSLPWAIVLAFSTYFVGRSCSMVKLLAACFLVAFLPLSLWIWDIPFTGRYIEQFHDSRLQVLGLTVMSRHFYELGMLLFAGLAGLALLKRSRAAA